MGRKIIPVLDFDREKIREIGKKTTEKIYRDNFANGRSVYFQDERTTKADTFIRANPDGSEDLVSLNLETRAYTLLEKLKKMGQGKYSYLIPQ